MSRRVRLSLIAVSLVLVTYAVLGSVLGQGDSTSEKTYRNLGVYSEVLSRIKQEYVVEPNLKRVTDGAIRGLLEALDPYSTYLDAQAYQGYLAQPEAGPADIGLYVSKRVGFLTVVSVLPGSPAEKAGLKVGDLLDRVNGAAARDLSVVQVQRMLAGPPGTSVSLAVVREAREEPQKIEVTRAILIYPPVVAKMVDDGTAYLRIATFNKGKAAEVAERLKELKAGKLVVDLRNCAGGEVQEAVDTASLFLEKSLVAYAMGQRYPRQDFMTKPTGSVYRLPVAVLINQSTAGPAELIAAGVLGNRRGEVVGTRSFGVGVLQKLLPVGDGSALLLTVAKFYGPDGKVIQDNGVTPSVIEAGGSDEDATPEGPERFGEKDDQQLRKAIEILNQKASAVKSA